MSVGEMGNPPDMFFVGDRHPITPALLPSRTKILVGAQGPRNPAEDSA
jgi:hypothetical protein